MSNIKGVYLYISNKENKGFRYGMVWYRRACKTTQIKVSTWLFPSLKKLV